MEVLEQIFQNKTNQEIANKLEAVLTAIRMGYLKL